jgi:glycosyltransferase involved in cell wall biosynthesis
MAYSSAKKIVYLTSRNAKDRKEWSGTMYYMAQSLSKHAGEVYYAGPYKPVVILFFLKIFRRISKSVFRKNYSLPYSYLLAWVYKIHFERKIRKIKPDIIFAPSASGEMSLIKADCPIVFLADITFRLLIDYYPNFTNLSKFSIREAELVERKAFSNASALIFSSGWAVNSALTDYNIPEPKVHMISFGANMDLIPERDDVIHKTINGPVKLLFLGVDWIRKGGDIVFNAFKQLQDQGVDVELTVCGCIPPENNPKMTVIPFLNKNNETDFKKLYQIFLETHFLFVPSKSDCTPIVFCEASAFGIPVLTSNAGGISSVVYNGINGYTLPVEAHFSEFSEIIHSYVTHEKNYNDFVVSSRNFYESNLNWSQWGKTVNNLFEDLIRKKGTILTHNNKAIK